MKHLAAVVSIACLLFVSKSQAQEHAPTMAVCQADLALWHNTEEETDYLNQETKRINDGVKNTNPLAKLTAIELTLRMIEMADCKSVDKAGSQDYYEMMRFYSDVVADRYRSFLERHDLMRKFRAEDDAGIR